MLFVIVWVLKCKVHDIEFLCRKKGKEEKFRHSTNGSYVESSNSKFIQACLPSIMQTINCVLLEVSTFENIINLVRNFMKNFKKNSESCFKFQWALQFLQAILEFLKYFSSHFFNKEKSLIIIKILSCHPFLECCSACNVNLIYICHYMEMESLLRI